jgi:hypothetical protein
VCCWCRGLVLGVMHAAAIACWAKVRGC